MLLHVNFAMPGSMISAKGNFRNSSRKQTVCRVRVERDCAGVQFSSGGQGSYHGCEYCQTAALPRLCTKSKQLYTWIHSTYLHDHISLQSWCVTQGLVSDSLIGFNKHKSLQLNKQKTSENCPSYDAKIHSPFSFAMQIFRHLVLILNHTASSQIQPSVYVKTKWEKIVITWLPVLNPPQSIIFLNFWNMCYLINPVFLWQINQLSTRWIY